ncbi:MAG: preprotein translocase subunit SecG [bacterium]
MLIWLKIAQIVSAILLIVVILLQSQGASLSGVFGGSNSVYRTKRGVEKTLLYATIVLAIIFCGIALASVVVTK